MPAASYFLNAALEHTLYYCITVKIPFYDRTAKLNFFSDDLRTSRITFFSFVIQQRQSIFCIDSASIGSIIVSGS